MATHEDRAGRRLVLALGSAGVGGPFLPACGGHRQLSYEALVGVFIFGGLMYGFFDMAPNTLGGDLERQHGRKVMTLLHAGKDGAGMLGAFGSGVALWAGLDFRAVYAALGVLLLLLAVLFLRLPLPHHLPPVGRDEPARPSERPQLPGLKESVLLAALFVGLISLTDAALSNYSSLYLRDTLSSGALVGALGVAAFQLARVLGNLGSTAALRRLGERRVLVLSGAGVALGTAALVATPVPLVNALGLFLIGLLESPIEPVSYSLAARATPERAGQAISMVWGAFYVAFLAGPLLTGGLADLLGLRLALALFVLTSLAMAALAYRKL